VLPPLSPTPYNINYIYIIALTFFIKKITTAKKRAAERASEIKWEKVSGVGRVRRQFSFSFFFKSTK
jgi:hypothetical protein